MRKWLIYPFIFSLVPVATLVARNYVEMQLKDAFRPLIASLLLAGLVLLIAQVFLHDWNKSGLVTLIALLLFFTYGHVYNLLHPLTIRGIMIFRHRTLFPLWFVLFLIIEFLVIKKVARPEKFTLWLNLFSIFMLIYPVAILTPTLIRQAEEDQSPQIAAVNNAEIAPANSPDIYYIILDSYAREDVLKKMGYDNGGFIGELAKRGFYVATCSQSNYAYTEFSLPSSLNSDYLDAINAAEHNTRISLLKHGAFRNFVEARGYQTVAFPTGFPWTEWTDADVYVGLQRPWTSLTEFERLFLNTTMMESFETFHASFLSSNGLRRDNTLLTLKTLKAIPTWSGKNFVFAMIITPHGPYVFGPDGEWSRYVDAETLDGDLHGYLDQVTFINREILKVIDTLVAGSKPAPVIIIQADHGPNEPLGVGASERLPILNAYYLPGTNLDELLYPSISPVNTFRLVLNSYFDQNLPLLEDRSYFSPFDDRDAFTPAPNTCPSLP